MITTYDLDTADESQVHGRTLWLTHEDHTVVATLPRTARMTYRFKGRRHSITLGSGRTMVVVVGNPAVIKDLWETLTDTPPTK